jgi:hypothetical protein
VGEELRPQRTVTSDERKAKSQNAFGDAENKESRSEFKIAPGPRNRLAMSQ